jgi:BRCT domain type II-containing protein
MSLSGKKIVFTGKLTMPRADAEQMAKDAGATVTKAVR